MIQMMPDSVADYLIQKYDKDETTFDEMQQHLDDYLLKIGSKASGKKGNLKQMGMAKEDDRIEEAEKDWQYKQDPTYGPCWVCTAIPAATRPRQEEQGSEEQVNPGQGKAKGKGKKGPAGGCHESGGDHYARHCEIRKVKIAADRALNESRGNGKGKSGKGGMYANIPQRYWNGYNPGFMKSQWNQWRPNPFKGKGKGDNAIGNMMPNFTFPSLELSAILLKKLL